MRSHTYPFWNESNPVLYGVKGSKESKRFNKVIFELHKYVYFQNPFLKISAEILHKYPNNPKYIKERKILPIDLSSNLVTTKKDLIPIMEQKFAQLDFKQCVRVLNILDFELKELYYYNNYKINQEHLKDCNMLYIFLKKKFFNCKFQLLNKAKFISNSWQFKYLKLIRPMAKLPCL